MSLLRRSGLLIVLSLRFHRFEPTSQAEPIQTEPL